MGAVAGRREQGSGGSCQRLNESETGWRKEPAS